MLRERQAEGWVAVWKDGLEQPFVKDRRSLTGADADTSATALHHLPFTGRANHGSLRERACSLHSSLPSPPSLPLASHPHAEQERYASQPVDGISEQCTTRGPTSGLISEDDPDMVMFTMQEMLQIDPRTINSHLQISHLVRETKRAPCSPTEPYTAA